jgi:septal ring factor EnvC (AmiA/AmiB activator)
VRIALLALFLLLGVAPAQAETQAQRAAKAAEAAKQLQQTRARIQALADEQKKIEAERDAAARALREADGKVAGGQRSLSDTEKELAAQQQALEDLQQKKLALEASLSRQHAELAALIRSAYALGRNEQLKLLLEQDRMSDLARVLAYHRYFEQNRQARVGSLQQELRSLAEVGKQIEGKRAQLLATRERQNGELKSLAEQKQARSRTVSTLDSQYRDKKARMSALGRDEKNTAALLERLRKLMAQLPKTAPPKPGTNKGKGGKNATSVVDKDPRIPMGPMRLPLTGSVLAGYGGVMPDGHRSQGLLIAGTAGAEVHAVAAGRVAYADWLKGYGLLIILDHGNGWMTL